jgi:hypothetical protein
MASMKTEISAADVFVEKVDNANTAVSHFKITPFVAGTLEVKEN